jgi:hypothetical protein
MPTAKVNGINMAYYVSGHGEPLVLVISNEESRQSWIFQK